VIPPVPAVEPVRWIRVPSRETEIEVPVYEFDALVIGSGAAGLNAAIHLVESGGPERVAVITDEWGGGASHNAGSDKQTYYKLSISGAGADSPLLMARDMFNGGSMHGDIALAEAAGSIEEFFHLVRLGVPFPADEYGIYPGYQTDNDQRQRATSVGPYTSREMVRTLARRVVELGIPVFDRHVAVRLITTGGEASTSVAGVACLVANTEAQDTPINGPEDAPLVLFEAPATILATGGPANLHADSVYPKGQHCSHGLAITAGVKFQNLAFMQYGIASREFRWNMSGSYQQAIPAYIVTEEDGSLRELLGGFMSSMKDVAFQEFLKGYNWPFNPARCDLGSANHSSIIDLAVHDATVLQAQKVLLDFCANPWDVTGESFAMEDLPEDALTYLQASGALQSTPIERLEALNPFAIEVFHDHGIDLWNEPVEIHVAVQHCNGGIAGDVNWESINMHGLFPVGEANGSHGQHRPGGSALNAGQVGGLRAARYLASSPLAKIDEDLFSASAMAACQSILSRCQPGAGPTEATVNVDGTWEDLRAIMDSAAGIVRNDVILEGAISNVESKIAKLNQDVWPSTGADFVAWFRLEDALVSSLTILSAMKQQLVDEPDVHPCYIVTPIPNAGMPDILGTGLGKGSMPVTTSNQVLLTWLDQGRIVHEWEEARPVPDVEDWFETLLKKIPRLD